MRPTTLTSLAVLALLCPLAPCMAQDAPPDKAAVEGAAQAAKDLDTHKDADASKSKAGKARFGTLSPDEARRAERARKRASAALKAREPKPTEAAEAPSQRETTIKRADAPAKPEPKESLKAAEAPPAPAKETAKSSETRREPTRAAEIPEETKTVKTVDAPPAKRPEARPPAPEPVTAAKAQPAKPVTTVEGRSARETTGVADAEPTRRTTRTAETRHRRVATRGDSRRAPTSDESAPPRYRIAGEGDRPPRVGDYVPPGVRLDPLPPRFWRYGRGYRPFVVGEGPRPVFEGRSGFGPRPYWRVIRRGPFMMAGYPPYPRPYVAYDEGP